MVPVQEKYERLSQMMNERLKRRWAACEALTIGRGGISAVSEATRMSRTTIRKGIREIQEEFPGLVGDFKNASREWRPQDSPEPVRTHDFRDKMGSRVYPNAKELLITADSTQCKKYDD